MRRAAGQSTSGRPDELFRPASVTKLFSTAAALVDLGPDFRFHTPVVRRGEVDAAGTLRGDLILIGKGDMCLGGRTGPDGNLLFLDNDHTYAGSGSDGDLVAADPLAGLDHLAREVRESGIQAITGDVLVDDRLFAPTSSTGSGPKRVSPIVINDNVIDVLVSPGARAGDPAVVRTVPANPPLEIDCQVETVAEGNRPRVEIRSVGPRACVLRGQIPAGHKPILRIHAVDQPDDFARSLLIQALRSRGVRVPASPLGENESAKLPSATETAQLPKVAEYLSPPLPEYLRVILKVSHNLHASTLPLLLASKANGGAPGANQASGLRREAEVLKSLGVDPNAISFGGGAGGSPADLVTPRATVTLLKAMAGRKAEFPAYEAALPVLGRDGTLAKAVAPESPARGHARAKTGTFWVSNEATGKTVLTSKALAGYLETSSGRRLVFAFFLNDLPLNVPADDIGEATSAAGKLLGQLCEIFYAADPSESRPDNE
ncbi:MAG: D-alanyl-D-alanine carboxypeptidase/D-alanyl-D-alanine-endopeptidase [Isosphaeraceae bacterium]